MYQSQELNDYINSGGMQTKEGKQEEIKRIIKKISDPFEVRGFAKKISKTDMFWIAYPFISLACLAVAYRSGNIGFTNTLADHVALGIALGIFASPLYTYLSRKKSARHSYSQNLQNLFMTLLDIPMEVRMIPERKANIPTDWRIKVLVEANEVKDGGHVLKEKTHHFTAYIDPLAPPQTVVKFISELVVKAEALKLKADRS